MLEVVKTQFIGFDTAICEVCDNYTPHVFIDEAGEDGCLICWEAYGEIHQAVIKMLQLDGVSKPKMSDPYVRFIVVRKDK